MADTNPQGVIAAARAAAPAAVGQQPAQPVTVPAAQAPIATPEGNGFGAPAQPNGFTAPQPQPTVEAPVQQATTISDNARTTEQFGKLTETNQRLAQTNELLRQELQRMNAVRQQSQQQFQPVQQVPSAPMQQSSAMPKLSDYIEVDPVSGERFVNEAKFNAAVADIYAKASRAEQVVQTYVQTAEQRERARQDREAFTAYPNLNPQGGKFDPLFAQQTRAIVYDSLINPQDYGGRPLGFKDAADFVVKSTGRAPSPTQATVQPPTVNTQNQVQKEQAAASVQNQPRAEMQAVDSDQEIRRQNMDTRLGKDEAIAFRLSLTPHRIDEVETTAR